MKQLYSILLFLVVAFTLTGCEPSKEQNETKKQNNDVDVTCNHQPHFFSEDFEGYQVGDFPSQMNADDWSYYKGSASILDWSVTDQGCASGKCLKTKMVTIGGGPYHSAFIYAKAGDYNIDPEVYIQFYTKYLYDDGRLNISIRTGSSMNFRMLHNNVYQENEGSIGIREWIDQYSGSPEFRTVIENKHIYNGIWYRFEIMIKDAIANIRVYEKDSIIPIEGSTLTEDISITPVNGYKNTPCRGKESKIHFIYHSTYMFEHLDSVDLEDFAFFIDDFMISDNSNILKAGF